MGEGQAIGKSIMREVCVESELQRRVCFRQLRQSFVSNCRSYRPSKGGVLSCFAKWHFELLRLSASSGDDPLMPSHPSSTALSALKRLLVSELFEDGFAESDAMAITDSLHADLHRAGHRLVKVIRQHGGAVSDVRLRPHENKDDLVDIVHGLVVLQLSQVRLEKLRQHYSTCSAEQDDQHFCRAVMIMMLRYQSLDGGGFQCALPPPIFDCLRILWGVSREGFASPLNCTLGAGEFHSAFADTDAVFGSRGSFFDDTRGGVVSGSYQLNPPFSAELYAALLERCQQLLNEAEAAHASLSYILVIGATASTLRLPCIRGIADSRFYRGQLRVGVADHVYVCGQQHMKSAPATFRACDSGVYFLQTSSAAVKWPVTKAKLAALRATFVATNNDGRALLPGANKKRRILEDGTVKKARRMPKEAYVGDDRLSSVGHGVQQYPRSCEKKVSYLVVLLAVMNDICLNQNIKNNCFPFPYIGEGAEEEIEAHCRHSGQV
jgi:hypothetical protein